MSLSLSHTHTHSERDTHTKWLYVTYTTSIIIKNKIKHVNKITTKRGKTCINLH